MPDYALAKTILAVGTNVAECFPIVMHWLWQARDHGATLIVVDPRETPMARTADLWLPVRPGTDIALLNCMLRQVIHDGLVDDAYVAERTTGWDQVRQTVEAYTPGEPNRSPGYRPSGLWLPRGSTDEPTRR